jgi:hypothetical protein
MCQHKNARWETKTQMTGRFTGEMLDYDTPDVEVVSTGVSYKVCNDCGEIVDAEPIEA